jgi:uncharacterized protein YdeI (YjbR/CyaY-like superfamily)
MQTNMNPRFFANAADFRKWLQQQHASASELWVGFYKKGSGKTGISYPEAVDQALCFGWIDGIRKSIDAVSYTNRFTPRRKGSIWSAINLKRVGELAAAGLMAPAGLKVFGERDVAKTNQYSFERENVHFSPAQLAQFKKRKRAWQFFESQPPSYRRLVTAWVTSAKQEATQQRRLAQLIADCAAGQRIAQLRPASRKKK